MIDKAWELLEGDYVEPLTLEAASGTEFRTPDNWWLTQEPIAHSYKRLRVQARRKVPQIPDFFYSGMLPLVSEKARRIFDRLGGFDGEFHGVDVYDATGTISEKNPFWYFRLMSTIDAIDYERSEIEFFPQTDRPRRVWKLNLIEERIAGCNAYRLRKMTSIFVSEEIRAACVAERLHMNFTPLSRFRLGW